MIIPRYGCLNLDMDKINFLDLSKKSIAALVKERGKPKLGVFVLDGSRRFVLAFTETKPGSNEFYRQCATIPAQSLLEILKIFFDHGLQILMVPILSRSVLNRGSDYQQHTARVGLELVFHSGLWHKFYDDYDIRVNVYGDLSYLSNTKCEDALDWIDNTRKKTRSNKTHRLFFAIGESPRLGQDIAKLGIDFFKENNRYPTIEEQIIHYYGELLPPADFFIMTSKLGLGALPKFLINGNTGVYFLPTPGGFGFDEQTFRLILYDLLFVRDGLSGDYTTAEITSEMREHLKTHYQNSQQIIGLGKKIDQTWVFE